MTSAHPVREVHWHVSARQMGIVLPPGYHILEAPLRFMLCVGEEEVRSYPLGVDSKEIEADAAVHAARAREVEPSAARKDDQVQPASARTESPSESPPVSEPTAVTEPTAPPAGATSLSKPVVRRREHGSSPKESVAPTGSEPLTEAPVRPSRPAWTSQITTASTRPADRERSHGAAEEQQRVVLRSVKMEVSGHVATATVELAYGATKATAKSVGHNTEERRLFLAAEAAARALTDFLPPGYGVVVHDVQLSPEVSEAVIAAVAFLTPADEHALLGIARIRDTIYETAACTVLNAVNRWLGAILTERA